MLCLDNIIWKVCVHMWMKFQISKSQRRNCQIFTIRKWISPRQKSDVARIPYEWREKCLLCCCAGTICLCIFHYKFFVALLTRLFPAFIEWNYISFGNAFSPYSLPVVDICRTSCLELGTATAPSSTTTGTSPTTPGLRLIRFQIVNTLWLKWWFKGNSVTSTDPNQHSDNRKRPDILILL